MSTPCIPNSPRNDSNANSTKESTGQTLPNDCCAGGVILVVKDPKHGDCVLLFKESYHRTSYMYHRTTLNNEHQWNSPVGRKETKHSDIAATAADELFEETCGLVLATHKLLLGQPQCTVHHSFLVGGFQLTCAATGLSSLAFSTWIFRIGLMYGTFVLTFIFLVVGFLLTAPVQLFKTQKVCWFGLKLTSAQFISQFLENQKVLLEQKKITKTNKWPRFMEMTDIALIPIANYKPNETTVVDVDGHILTLRYPIQKSVIDLARETLNMDNKHQQERMVQNVNSLPSMTSMISPLPDDIYTRKISIDGSDEGENKVTPRKEPHPRKSDRGSYRNKTDNKIDVLQHVRTRTTIKQFLNDRSSAVQISNNKQIAGNMTGSFEGSTIEENVHSRPGSPLYEQFLKALTSVPDGTIELVFHGTAEENVGSILQNGLDENYRTHQMYGAGEYFATRTSGAHSHCKGGQRMLIFAVLITANVSQGLTTDTRHGYINGYYSSYWTYFKSLFRYFSKLPSKMLKDTGSDIIVINKTSHQLPLFVVSFDEETIQKNKKKRKNMMKRKSKKRNKKKEDKENKRN